MAPDKTALDQLKIHRPAGPGKAGRFAAIGLAAIVVAALVGLWWLNRPRAMPVKTALARQSAQGDAATLLNASGYVTARREATVSSKVTGPVLDVLVEEGMRVSEGQVLAHIDSSNIEASLNLARAQLESARSALGETAASLDLAEKTLRRSEELASKAVVSAADLDTASAEAAALQARLARQKADVAVAERAEQIWRQQMADTVIRAPFEGVVTSKNAMPGELISPMSAGGSFTRTGICTIVDMTSLEVEVDVNESYINRVTPGQPVVAVLDSYPDWKIPAHVIAIIPTADRQKATVKVRVGFDKLDPRFLPDMSLKVAFQAASGGAPVREVIVPKTAVAHADGRDIVWVVRDGRVERRAIALGLVRDEEAVVASGLEGGERVVIEGAEGLSEGVRVAEKNS